MTEKLTSADIQRATERLTAYLVNRIEAMSATERKRARVVIAEFSPQLLPLLTLDDAPTPAQPLRPGEGAGIADDVAVWLAGG